MKRTETAKMLRGLLLTGLLVIVTIAGPVLGPASTAASQTGDTTLELPAMILTPTDLGLAGMARYPIEQAGGMMQTARATAQEFVDFERVPAERAHAVFVESGLIRRYHYLYILKYPNDPVPAVYTARLVLTSVYEFPDAVTAAATFGSLARLLGRDAPELTSATRIGDESRLVSTAAPELNVNAEMSMTFRTGRLIVHVAIRDDVANPDQATVEALARRLLDRVQTVTNEGGPGLSHYVLRFPAEVVMTGPFEGYNLLDGNVVVRDTGYVDIFRPVLATAAAGAGALDGYDLSNALVMEGGGWAGDHGSTVFRFSDADSAAAWLHSLPSRLATTSARDLKTAHAPGVGDEAFLATYRSEPTDIIQAHRIGAVRVGALVAVLTGSDIPAEAALQLLTAQATCLAAGGCSGPVAVPASPRITETTQ